MRVCYGFVEHKMRKQKKHLVLSAVEWCYALSMFPMVSLIIMYKDTFVLMKAYLWDYTNIVKQFIAIGTDIGQGLK